MTELARAEVVLSGTDAPLQRTLAGAQGRMNTVGKSLQRTADKVKNKFTSLEDSTLSLRKGLGILAGATGAAFAAKKIFDMGSAVEETANKFDVVMGRAADDARRRLIDLTETIPLLQSEMEGMSAGIQDLLVPMGVARTEAAGMSVGMVKLAGDLASFNNVRADRVLEAMKSALAGASEPMRRFGVDTRVARLEALALEEGLIQQGEALDNAATAQAVMLAIQRDSTDAMGDAARTADSAANTMRFFLRDVKQAAENVSVALVPALKEFVGEGADMLGSLEGITSELQNQAPVLAAWAKFAVQAGKFAAQAFAAPIRIAFNLGQVIGRLGGIMALVSQGRFAEAREVAGQLKGDFGDMKNVVTGLIDSFTGMQDAAGEAFETFASGSEESDDLGESLGGVEQRARGAAAAIREVKRASAGGVVGERAPEPEGTGGPQALPVPDIDLLQRSEELYERLFNKIGQNGVAVARIVQNSFSNAFGALISGAKSFGDAFAQLAKNILTQLAGMVAQALVFAAIMTAFGGTPLGFGALFKQGFAGGFQHGGRIRRGQFGIVGEAGPEIVSGPANVTSTARTAQMMGGPDGATALAAVLSSAVPPPREAPPQEMARDRYWRSLLAEGVEVLKQDGVRFG